MGRVGARAGLAAKRFAATERVPLSTRREPARYSAVVVACHPGRRFQRPRKSHNGRSVQSSPRPLPHANGFCSSFSPAATERRAREDRCRRCASRGYANRASCSRRRARRRGRRSQWVSDRTFGATRRAIRRRSSSGPLSRRVRRVRRPRAHRPLRALRAHAESEAWAWAWRPTPSPRRRAPQPPPIEALGRLAALVPPPRYPLLRFHGVVAPRHRWRDRVVPRPPVRAPLCKGAVRRGARARRPAG